MRLFVVMQRFNSTFPFHAFNKYRKCLCNIIQSSSRYISFVLLLLDDDNKYPIKKGQLKNDVIADVTLVLRVLLTQTWCLYNG